MLTYIVILSINKTFIFSSMAYWLWLTYSKQVKVLAAAKEEQVMYKMYDILITEQNETYVHLSYTT